MEADEVLALSIFFGIPLVCLVYAVIRATMAGGRAADGSGWRDITVIDVAIILAAISVFIPLTPT